MGKPETGRWTEERQIQRKGGASPLHCQTHHATTQLIIITIIDDKSKNNHDNLVQPEGVPGSVDCYTASLRIDQATPEDSRQYRCSY